MTSTLQASRVATRAIQAHPTIDSVIALAGRLDQPAILDSANTHPARGRYTIITANPVEVLEWKSPDTNLFQALRRHLSPMPELPGLDLPFAGGWIGYFAYEAGRCLEELPATTMDDPVLPVARFGLYLDAVIHDALTDRWTAVAVLPPADSGFHLAPLEQRLDEWEHILRKAEQDRSPPPGPPVLSVPQANMTRDDYLKKVARVRQYIADGDVFQVNITRRLRFASHEPPLDVYRRLRLTNPGAYSAFLHWKESSSGNHAPMAVLSSSPELFLHVRDRDVITRPIKGTMPRSPEPATDAMWRQKLVQSTKDRAELAMIVDLLRNDLGRVCRYGSIRVAGSDDSTAGPYELETHATVHHLVATVTGKLRDDCDVIDLLAASFPGGSITGAPKIRAMQIIDELEPTCRSVYTGSIGYFSLDGASTFNIAIRTAIAADGCYYVYTGGGIVADSVPELEYEETCAKAEGVCRAITATGTAEPTGDTAMATRIGS